MEKTWQQQELDRVKEMQTQLDSLIGGVALPPSVVEVIAEVSNQLGYTKTYIDDNIPTPKYSRS